MILSKHFIENWRVRVGGEPTPETVRAVIAGSIQIQKQTVIRRVDGSSFATLSIYWQPELGLIVKTDDRQRIAVTVMDAGIRERKEKREGIHGRG